MLTNSRYNAGVMILAFILFALGVRSTAQGAPELFHITGGTSHSQSEFHQISVSNGEQIELLKLQGPGEITYLYFTDDTAGRWYPGLVLKVFWDDQREPSILVPVADFFGAIGGKAVDYQSALMQINHACFASYLPMPYSKGARVMLCNDGDRDYSQKVAYGVDWESDPVYAKEKSRLHCEWRRSSPVTNGVHTILDIHGRGQYIGNFLQVASRSPGIWFGEGDTLFHLDDQSFVHTPGTEDEYGSCWEDPHWRTFSSLYCGHILNEQGVNRMFRWYAANPVRFQHSLKVEIQNQHENGKPTSTDADDYISVAFWFQEGAHAVKPLPGFAERTTRSRVNAP